jgi:hypothetical protein
MGKYKQTSFLKILIVGINFNVYLKNNLFIVKVKP